MRKNNENFNLPKIESWITIKEQYLKKYQKDILALPKEKADFIYLQNWLDLAEYALMSGSIRLANQLYRDSRRFGVIGIRRWVRRLFFLIRTVF